jgi:hypothetical protein
MIVFLISVVLKHFCRSYSGEHIGSGSGVSCSKVKKRKNISTKLVRPFKQKKASKKKLVKPGDIDFGIFFLLWMAYYV